MSKPIRLGIGKLVLFIRFARGIFAIFDRSPWEFQFLKAAIVSIGSRVGANFCMATVAFFMTFFKKVSRPQREKQLRNSCRLVNPTRYGLGWRFAFGKPGMSVASLHPEGGVVPLLKLKENTSCRDCFGTVSIEMSGEFIAT
jgi:hypothetical protein